MKTLKMQPFLCLLGLGHLLLDLVILLLLLLPKPPLQVVDLDFLLHPALYLTSNATMLPLSVLLYLLGPSWTGPALATLIYLFLSILSLVLLLHYCFSSCSSLLLLLPRFLVQAILWLFIVGVTVIVLLSPSSDISFILSLALLLVLLFTTTSSLVVLLSEIHLVSRAPPTNPQMVSWTTREKKEPGPLAEERKRNREDTEQRTRQSVMEQVALQWVGEIWRRSCQDPPSTSLLPLYQLHRPDSPSGLDC